MFTPRMTLAIVTESVPLQSPTQAGAIAVGVDVADGVAVEVLPGAAVAVGVGVGVAVPPCGAVPVGVGVALGIGTVPPSSNEPTEQWL